MGEPDAFRVDTPLVTLAVTLSDDVVTGIRLGVAAGRDPARDAELRVSRQLAEYIEGRRTGFDFPWRTQGSPFEQAVWAELGRIPYGQTATYGDVARRVGHPRAARAVGLANHRNPIPIAIPCHRVVAAGGKLGGYGGGIDLKRKLLQLEQAHGAALHAS